MLHVANDDKVSDNLHEQANISFLHNDYFCAPLCL